MASPQRCHVSITPEEQLKGGGKEDRKKKRKEGWNKEMKEGNKISINFTKL